MKILQINDIEVKPIRYDNENQLPVKGANLFETCYANIFVLAKKRSGKTTVIYRMVQKCIDKNTKVFIFCSTVHKDPAYKKMLDFFERRHIEYDIFTSLQEDGVNVLSHIMNELKNDDSDTDSSDSDIDIQKNGIFDVTDDESIQKRKKSKPKYLTPKYLFIFDDMGTTLKSKDIDQLLKTNRHYKARVIISSQYLNDISIASRLQLDYMLMFKGLSMDKLAEAYKNLDLSIDFADFLKMYNLATYDKYNFFYIDIRGERFRRNFNIEMVVENK